ncbi:MAG: DNA polymerase I, partial [Gammaproteobacteria bacterium]|nr:DNA polymerase I [Gammaproteobacteria bacterium]
RTLISTGDKDMAQLVDDHITLINTMTNQVFDRNGVIEKFGVAPEKIIDYLTLVGDTSDNVPGVHKCGPKTAVKWLEQYGSLESIMQAADSVTGKIGEELRAALPQLPLSRTLVTIKLNVELELTPEKLTLAFADNQTLAQLYERYEFKNWLAEVSADPNVAIKTPEPVTEKQYHTVFTEAEFETCLQEITAAKYFSFDTETTSLDYIDAELVGISLSVTPGVAYYIPVAHDYIDAPKQLARDAVLKKLKPILEDPKKLKVGQHLKYDKNVLVKYDINLQGIAYDTMLESYVLNSTSTRHDLDTLAMKYLERKTITFEDVAGTGKKQLTFNQVEVEAATAYAAEDADVTLQLHHALWPQLEANTQLLQLYNAIEIPLVPILSVIETTGVLVDAKRLGKLSAEFAENMAILQEKTFTLAGEEFNMDSPKQLQEILFTKLGLPVIKKTPTGQPSTAEPVLAELAHDYELPKLITEYRSFAKLKSTYSDKLPLLINAKTGRVHTSYHQAMTSTGRLSSSDPNLQNIPIRTSAGREIRQAFIAPPGHEIVAADYSQIELRIMAHLSGDKSLLDAFAHGLDIHKATAAEVFGTSVAEVTDEQRRRAKAINFGLIYGMSAFGLAKQLDVPRHSAQDYIDLYFARFPGVKKYMDNTREQAHKLGYVETLFGRRLYLPQINDRNKMLQQAAERAAINAPMQGTAADIIKIAMINVYTELQRVKLDVKMIMQVHDELVFEVATADLAAAQKIIETQMMGAAEMAVPLVVGMNHGDNWDAAH